MMIVIASDHNGNEVRRFLLEHLSKNRPGLPCVDMGPISDGKVDYVDYAQRVAYAVQAGHRYDVRGVLICGTGIGMSIVANRFPGVRASMVTDVETARLTRDHNNSNVLVLGAWKNSHEHMIEILDTWLDTPFGHGRHVPRVAKIDSLGSSNVVLVPGIFDGLRPGHISLFQHAKKFGKVVVALNSDLSVERLTGHPPISPVNDRRRLVDSLSLVDEVIINEYDDVGGIVSMAGVTHILKGDRFTEEQVRKTDKVPPHVHVILFPEEI